MARARPIAWIFRGLIASIAIIVVAAVIIAGRLSQGPISLDQFKPRLETALAESLGGKDSTIDRLTLDASDGRIALSAFGVVTHGENGQTLARAKQINLRLAPQALMRGEIEPTRLDVVGARLVAIRDASGPLQLLAMTDDSEPTDQDAPDIFALVRKWLSGEASNAQLPDIRLEKASFRALDNVSGEVLWEGVADAGFTLQGARASVWAIIGFDSTRDASPLRLSGTLIQQEGGHASATLTAAKLSALARIGRLLGANLPPLDGSVEGAANITINSDLLPTSARAALSIAEIEIALPGGRQIALDRAAVEAELDIPSGKLVVTGMRLGEHGTDLIGAATLTSLPSDEGQSSYAVAGRIDHANLNYLAALAGSEEAVAGVDLAFSADFDLAFKNGELATVESWVSAKGEVNPTGLFMEPLLLKDLQTLISFDATERKVSVLGLTTELGGIALSAEGTATLGTSEAIETLNVKARLGTFPIETLAEVWPIRISPGGRKWVARNLSKGRITGGDILISKRKGLPLDVASNFAADGLSVRYWDPMPSATGVVGKGTILGDTLTLNISRGGSGGLTTNKVKVIFTKLGSPKEYIKIDGAIQGPVAKLLAILDRPPLKYAEWLGVRPTETKGLIDGKLHMKFPLVDKLSLDDLAITASGNVTNAFLPKVVAGWDLSARAMDIKVDTKRLKVSGDGTLLNEPLHFNGDLVFGPGEERAKFEGNWRLTREIRREIGLGAPAIRHRLTGITPAAFTVVARPKKLYEIDIDADLKAATLLAQEIGWLKPKGAPARVRAHIQLQDGIPTRVDSIKLRAKNFQVDADIDFAGISGEVSHISVRHLKGAGHDLSGHIAFGRDVDRIHITGARADLRPLFNLNRNPKKGAAGAETKSKPQEFQIELAHARLTEALTLNVLRASARLNGGWPEAVTAQAEYPGGELRVSRDKAEPNWLRLTVSDFGRLLAAARATNGLKGQDGTLLLRREAVDDLSLVFETENFTFSKAALVALVGEESAGILDTFAQGNAIHFDDMDVIGRYSGGRLSLQSSSIRGNAIGITSSGVIDFRKRALDINGALTPAYGLSRVLGSIPIIGTLLTGQKREGLFAANYQAFGALDAPEFKVDAFSALAPGILREALTSQERQPEQSQENVNDP